MAKDRLTRLEAPAYLLDKWSLRCSHRTLARLAVIGGGPAFRKTGRDTLYDIASLDAWAQQKLGPAAETAAEHREIAAVILGAIVDILPASTVDAEHAAPPAPADGEQH
jgi:hypothetical protein